MPAAPRTTPVATSTSPARVLMAPDANFFPTMLGLPGTAWDDGTLLINEDSGEAYFWNALSANPTMKWEPIT